MTTDIQTFPAEPGATLRLFVIVLAVAHAISAFFGLSAFNDLSQYVGKGLAQWLLLTGFAIFPLLAVAALFFAFKGNIGRAIMSVALIVIVEFVTDQLPSLVVQGMDLRGGTALINLYFYVKIFVFPLLAVVAFVLGRRNERLALAAAFASLSMISAVFDVIAFAVGVFIYGF